MTSAERPVSGFPLLPSPKGGSIVAEEIQTEPSPEKFIPAGFEEIVATATLNYIANLNAKSRSRGGQAVLPLNLDGQKRATRIIFDALKLAPETKGLTVIPTKPKELKNAINAGLKLREEEKATGQSLIAQLKQAGKTGSGKPVYFDLGFDKKLIDAAAQEIFRYSVVAQPLNTRKLLALVPPRKEAVKQMSVTAAASYMSEHQEGLSDVMPADEFIESNLGFISELLNTEGKQASVNRGTIVAAAIQLIKKGAKPNPTFLEPNDLKLMTTAFRNPKVDSEIPELAAKTAKKLLVHSPKLIRTGIAAMEAFSGQIRQAVILAEKAKFSRGDNQITFLTAQAEIFKIFPTSPMLDSGTLITKADLLPSAGPDVHHLWENAVRITAGPNRLALIPTPEQLISAKTFLGSIRTSDDRLNNDRERLLRAIRAWREYQTVKMNLPGKIKKLDIRIKELVKYSKGKSSIPTEIQDLHPLQLDAMIQGESGRISVLTRTINQANATLSTHRQLSIVAESAAPDQFTIRFLLFRQKQAGRRREAVERKKDTDFDPEPTYSLTDFPRHPFEIMPDAEPETPAEELIRIRGYLAELSADKTKPLPNEFLSDRQALWNYLRLWQKRLPLGKHGKHRFDKVNTGISILSNAKGDNIGRNFWRLWFIDEAQKRESVLVNRSEKVQRYHDDKVELDLIRDALSSKDPNLITRTAEQLAEGQHSVPLDRWIKMQAVPLDFLKKLKAAGKNDQSPESRQLQQAQELVKLYRNASSRIQMRIPHLDRVNKALDDKLRAAQNYKGSKIATIATINQLMLARRDHNPLVPLDIAEGATLGELIVATNLRIEVAKAVRELDGLVAERESAKQEIAELKELRALKEQAVSVDQLKFQREKGARELKTADSRLIETMEALNLAADPEMIPKKSKNK